MPPAPVWCWSPARAECAQGAPCRLAWDSRSSGHGTQAVASESVAASWQPHCCRSLALQHFSESILEYLANLDQAPDPTVRKDTFAADISGAYDVLFHHWLQSREAKVRPAISQGPADSPWGTRATGSQRKGVVSSVYTVVTGSCLLPGCP